MRPAAAAFVAATLAPGMACAQQPAPAPAPEAEPRWEIAATAYWNSPRASDDYASGIFTADRGSLHLEGRANYEAIHAQSAFVGWKFSTGEAVRVEVTPILGFVGGSTRGGIAGFEASVTAGKFDGYLEAEYVHDRGDSASSYTYAWSELGYAPAEWVRLGLVAQRTRIYGGDREVQRGGFAQVVVGKVTAGVYWFNPGTSDQVVIAAVGLAF